MLGSVAISHALARAFPSSGTPKQVSRSHESHPDSRALKEALDGKLWTQVPGEFWRANPDYIAILPCDAFLYFLPSILVSTLTDPPDDLLVESLLIHLTKAETKECLQQLTRPQEASFYAVMIALLENDESDLGRRVLQDISARISHRQDP